MGITAHRHVTTAEAALDSPGTYLAEILSAVRPLLPCRLGLEDADGATLAEDVTAHGPLPLFDNSAMDGYAVRAADVVAATAAAPVILPVAAEVAAGDSRGLELAAGTCARIMTGAPIPLGADAVVRAEWTNGGTTKVTIHQAVSRARRSGVRAVRPPGRRCC
jgi:molybdopterin molybdotransferase